MRAKRYYKRDIARALDSARGCERGLTGFEILLYGWRVKHKMTSETIRRREWLTYAEVDDFSRYVGVDLRQTGKLPPKSGK